MLFFGSYAYAFCIHSAAILSIVTMQNCHMPTEFSDRVKVDSCTIPFSTRVPVGALSRSLAASHLPGKLVEAHVVHLDPAHVLVPLPVLAFGHRIRRDVILEVLSGQPGLWLQFTIKTRTHLCLLQPCTL